VTEYLLFDALWGGMDNSDQIEADTGIIGIGADLTRRLRQGCLLSSH
jgi:hypothetical protein